MAKKSVWIDNTTPPTNYIWVKTDEYGEIVGVFQYDGSTWVRLAIGNTTTVEGDGKISAITLNGDAIDIPYSMDPLSSTIVVRSDTGTIKSTTPTGDDSKEVVTVELLLWKDCK